MSMNLRQIEVFRAVMTTGSISGASRVLHVSQPAVSRLLSYTESRLGFALFERIKGRLYATPEAKQLIREVENVYLGVQRVSELAHDLADRRHGLLHVVSSPSIGQTLIPQVIARFRQSNADVRVTFQFLSYAHLKDRLLNRQADLGVVILPMDHPNLQVTPIARGTMVCICPYNHPLARRSTLNLVDLRPFALVSYGRDTPLGMRIADMYEAVDEPLKAAIEVGSPQNACALVEMGAGIAIVDEFSVRSWPANHFVVRPLAGAPSLIANLVYPCYEPLSQPAQAFVGTLRALLAQQGFASPDADVPANDGASELLRHAA
ncbi:MULTISPECIES: LysR family transcriptional regulator [unclassified Variovorax]|uniref:LysR family transcriptional regulator n=1 Tax=unclassified Variovorax TaxID=663243 RepID=UPI003ED09E54